MTMASTRSPLLMRIADTLLAVLGLILAAGGGYLIALRGAWFYLFAGVAIAGVGAGLWRARAWALWLALALLATSAVWAYSEVGGESRAAIGLKSSGVLALVMLVALVGIFAGMFHPRPLVVALDAASGKEKWRYDLQPRITESTRGWKCCRGVGYADLNKLDVASADLSAPAGGAGAVPAAEFLTACRRAW
ncbi:hypothetical protein [Pseudochelatococcus sp. G4_1912]|uniref:hypothetical protein n=1 Tax=Pseudochelatococcus sp. G4_1912 TaxID=3114288 RepID=UPI0039C5AC2A